MKNYSEKFSPQGCNSENPYLLLFFFFINLVAESNRTPFDLLESESELIAGYLVEYSGFDFTLIYLSEYGFLIINSYILFILFSFPISFSLFIFVLLRSLLPRYKFLSLLSLS